MKKLKGKREKKRWLSIVLCLGLLITSIPFITGFKGAEAKEERSPAMIVEKMKELKYSLGGSNLVDYEVSPSIRSPYAAGKVQKEDLQNALNALNLVRYVAGLEPVTLDDTYTNYTQHGSVLLAAIDGGLNHYPSKPADMEDDFYQLGYKGTSSSNIFAGSSGWFNIADSVMSYMNDSDESNRSVLGHRRWILNPSMQKTGFGFADAQKWSYSCMYSVDGFVNNASDIVCWPATYTPYCLYTDMINFGQNPYFSVSLSGWDQLDKSKVKVTVKNQKTDEVINLDGNTAESDTRYFNVSNAGTGIDRCVIFYFGGCQKGDVYDIEISGITKGGKDTPYQYTVNIFDEEAVTPEEPSTEETTTEPESTTKETTTEPESTMEEMTTEPESTTEETTTEPESTTEETTTEPESTTEETTTEPESTTEEATTEPESTAEDPTKPTESISIIYQSHVQNIGWQDVVSDGAISGTVSEGKRLEAIKVSLNKELRGISYRSYSKDGWQSWKKDGQVSGTAGKSVSLEALQMKLTGELAEKYDIYYRTHAQDYGWLDWAKNGQTAGTTSMNKRLEAIEIRIVPKGQSAPGETKRPYIHELESVTYQAHIQNMGWQSWKQEEELAGTIDIGLRMEAIRGKLTNKFLKGDIQYQTHVQNIGWLDWTSNGALNGTTGRNLRVEAIRVQLTGEMSERYQVLYRVHVQDYGWTDWISDGNTAGTTGQSKRLEAVEMKLVPKVTE